MCSAPAGSREGIRSAPRASCPYSCFHRERTMGLKAGWRGRFWEDFEDGDIYEHPLGRTILAADTSWYTRLTQISAPLHYDANYAAQTEFARPIVNSCV